MATPLDRAEQDRLLEREADRAGGAPKTDCPNCGLSAEGVRCPRCNALKVRSCSGACSACGSRCSDRK